MQMLQEGVRSIQDSRNYRSYLKTMASFPSYSPSNTLLIYSQCPEATLVAGYQTWKNRYGRFVRKGEKAIRIFAPYTYRTKERDDQDALVSGTKIGFRAISVFDISQTEGKELPEIISERSLEKSVEAYDQIFEIMRKELEFEIRFERLEEGVKGCCRYWENTIRIQKDMPQLQTVKTLFHEGAHSVLHNPYGEISDEFAEFVLENPNIREMEAESVAYVVCAWLNLDCSEYSFPYVACWKKEDKFFEKSLRRIQRTAEKFISALSIELFPEQQSINPSESEEFIPVPSGARRPVRLPLKA